MLRAGSSAPLRQLVNTEVSKFICHNMGRRESSTGALNAIHVAHRSHVSGSKVLRDTTEIQLRLDDGVKSTGFI